MSRVSDQQASLPTRPPVQTMPPLVIVFLASLGLALGMIFLTFQEVAQPLATLIFKHSGLAQDRGLNQEAWLGLLVACYTDGKCNPWLTAHLSSGMTGWYWYLLIPLIITPIVAKFIPKQKKAVMKDPGKAQWETKERLNHYLSGNDHPNDPFIGFLGYLKSGKEGGDFDTRNLPALFVPREDWCQNTLVWGGIRSGKTTAFFQPNIFLAAHLGLTCVVFDVKWPQKNSGFYETIGYWNARKRPVVLLAPFEDYGSRVNLLSGVNKFSDALEVADAVFPPPEYQEERGKHYNEKKRFMIAAMIWLLVSEKGTQATMGDVLKYVMMQDDRLEAWTDMVRDEDAKAILHNFREAGASSWAETKNGIISALKVFFNPQVVHATSGEPHETVDLEQVFMVPTLALVGINQKNQMDGSGEVLFRLYKRLFDQAAMRVAEKQGGRLRVHAAFFLDELPAIGKINYLMRSLGTLRSYNISHHLGIQNKAQGELVFGEIYWKAISTNVIARIVIFPRGINGDDAQLVADTIGKTTSTAISVGGSRNLDLTNPTASYSASANLEAVHLLAFEEFSQFSLGEAVVRINGQHPIRTQLVPMNLPYVSGTGISTGFMARKHPNVLHHLYQETVARCPGGLIAYTTKLIQDGALMQGKPAPSSPAVGTAGGAPPKPVGVQAAAPSGKGLSLPATLAQPMQPTSTAQMPLPFTVEQRAPAPAKPSQVNMDVEEVYRWLRECMAYFVDVHVQDDRVSVRLNTQDDQAVNGSKRVDLLFIGGLLEKNRTGMNAVLSARALDQLPTDLRAELRDYPDAKHVHQWLRRNALQLRGAPEREAYERECEANGTQPLALLDAFLEEGVLVSRRTVTREAFQNTNTGLIFPERRIGTFHYDVIPVQSFAATAEAVRLARANHATQPAKASGASRRSRKQNRELVVQQVLLSADSEGGEAEAPQ